MQETVERLKEAREAALQGRFGEAHRLASEVRLGHPDCLLALRIVAWAELEVGLGGAEATFRACKAIDPLDPLAEVGLAMSVEALGQPQSALQHFLRAHELDPSDQRIRLEVKRLGGELPESGLADGLALLQSGQYEQAVEPLRTASAAGQDPAPRLGLAHALWHLGGAREQVDNLCKSLLSNHPKCLEALIYAVAAELAMGRTLRMRELLGRVEAIDPGYQLSAPLLADTGVSRAIQGVVRLTGSPAAAAALSRPGPVGV